MSAMSFIAAACAAFRALLAPLRPVRVLRPVRAVAPTGALAPGDVRLLKSRRPGVCDCPDPRALPVLIPSALSRALLVVLSAATASPSATGASGGTASAWACGCAW